MLVHYGFTTKEGFMVEIHRYKLLKGCTQSRSLFCIYVRQLGSHYCTSFNSKPKFSWLLSTYTLTPLYAELALAFSPKKKNGTSETTLKNLSLFYNNYYCTSYFKCHKHHVRAPSSQQDKGFLV